MLGPIKPSPCFKDISMHLFLDDGASYPKLSRQRKRHKPACSVHLIKTNVNLPQRIAKYAAAAAHCSLTRLRGTRRMDKKCVFTQNITAEENKTVIFHHFLRSKCWTTSCLFFAVHSASFAFPIGSCFFVFCTAGYKE